PIQRAIMAGDRETAVSIMRMDEGLDTGPVCASDAITIGPDMTAGELHDLMATRGAVLMAQALAALETGTLECAPQPTDGITYAAKIEKTETQIDWSRPAEEVHNHIRGLAPWPGAHFEVMHDGRPERLKVLRTMPHKGAGAGAPGTFMDGAGTIACGTGAIRLLEIQRAGKKPMAIADLLRGFPLPAGTCVLGAPAVAKR